VLVLRDNLIIILCMQCATNMHGYLCIAAVGNDTIPDSHAITATLIEMIKEERISMNCLFCEQGNHVKLLICSEYIESNEMRR
jgi:hypothetical protein